MITYFRSLILIIFIFFTLFFTSLRVFAQSNSFPVNITINSISPIPISKYIWGAGLGIAPGLDGNEKVLTSQDFFDKYISEDKIKNVGIKLLRFPQGIWADEYNWKAACFQSNYGNKPYVDYFSVDEALNFAHRIGADLLYTVNIAVSGSTCGVSSFNGALQDAVDLVQKYKDKITYYEIGNEPESDWDAEKYQQVALSFAHAMKAVSPSIKLAAVGYPSTNPSTGPVADYMKPFLNPQKEAQWNNIINQLIHSDCSGVPCFDFVTDHPYPLSVGYHPYATNYYPVNFPGKAAYYSSIIYPKVFQRRNSDYSPAKYDVSEWNLFCGDSDPGSGAPINISNPSFEYGSVDWSFWSVHPNTGNIQTTTEEHYDGNSSMKLVLSSSSGQDRDDVTVAQPLNVSPNKHIQAFVYIKTDKPEYVSFSLQQINTGQHQWQLIGESSLKTIKPNSWQPVMVEGTTFNDTTSLQIVLGAGKSRADWANDHNPVNVYIDKVWSIYSSIYVSPGSVKTVEQGIFILESILQMAKNNVHMSSIHYLGVGTDGCVLFDSSKNPTATTQTFSLSSVLAGGKLLDTKTDSLNKFLPLDENCDENDFSCLRGGVDAPYVSSYSGISPDGTTYVLIINRHDSQSGNTTLDLSRLANVSLGNFTAKYLTAKSYTDKTFNEHDETMLLTTTKKLTFNIPPVSIVRLQIPSSGNILGDVNHDGKVDINDYNQLVSDFGKTNTSSDINNDGKVDIFDYNILVGNFGK